MTSPISTSSPFPFADLPTEMQLKVFSHLDIPDLASASLASIDCYILANDRSTCANVIENIGLKNLEGKTLTEKIKKIHELGKVYFPEVIEKTITIENTKETIRKINEIKIKDTLKVWEKIYDQAQPIAGKAAIETPKFDELKKSTDKKNIKQAFANWINNNKDNFNLTELDLTFSNLYYLPKEIGNLAQLQRLDLASNKLTSIPKEIGSLPQLQWLSLFNNNLTSIPKKIGNLPQLHDLDLRNNSISYYPDCLDRLTNRDCCILN